MNPFTWFFSLPIWLYRHWWPRMPLDHWAFSMFMFVYVMTIVLLLRLILAIAYALLRSILSV